MIKFVADGFLKNRVPTGYGRQKVLQIVYLLKFYDII